MREGQRVHLYGDFGTVLVDHDPHEVRIRWDEGGAAGQVIYPDWPHLSSVDLVVYPTTRQRLAILQTLEKLRVLTKHESSSWVPGVNVWVMRDFSRAPLWVREMYVRTGSVTHKEPSTKDDG